MTFLERCIKERLGVEKRRRRKRERREAGVGRNLSSSTLDGAGTNNSTFCFRDHNLRVKRDPRYTFIPNPSTIRPRRVGVKVEVEVVADMVEVAAVEVMVAEVMAVGVTEEGEAVEEEVAEDGDGENLVKLFTPTKDGDGVIRIEGKKVSIPVTLRGQIRTIKTKISIKNKTY